MLENLEGSSDLLKDLPSFGFTPENLQNPELIQMVESIQQLSKLIQSTVSGDSKNNRIYFESIKGVMRDIANRVMSLQGEIPLPLRKYVEFFKQFNAALLVDIEMADLLFDQLKGVHTDVAEADQIGDDKVFLDWLPDQENKLSGNLHGTPEIKERVDPLLMGNQPFFADGRFMDNNVPARCPDSRRLPLRDPSITSRRPDRQCHSMDTHRQPPPCHRNQTAEVGVCQPRRPAARFPGSGREPLSVLPVLRQFRRGRRNGLRDIFIIEQCQPLPAKLANPRIHPAGTRVAGRIT